MKKIEKSVALPQNRIFRILCRDKAADYSVHFTLSGLHLTPMTPAKLSRSCCKFSTSSLGQLDIASDDIIACKSAGLTSMNLTSNFGVPLFMIITYSSSVMGTKSPSISKSRLVYYFHALVQGETFNYNAKQAEDEEDDSGLASTGSVSSNKQDMLIKSILMIMEEWVSAVQCYFLPWKFHDRLEIKCGTFISRTILVLLNPNPEAEGNPDALRVFKEIVRPVLCDADLHFELLIVEHRGHAYKVMKAENLARWRAVVVLGKDGTVVEVFNGLFDRHDWQDALGHLAVFSVPLDNEYKGNAFAKSFGHFQSLNLPVIGTMSFALTAVKARTNPMDLIFVQTKEVSKVGILGISWGFLSPGYPPDIMGSCQLFTSLKRRFQINKVRPIGAVLSYLPVKRQNTQQHRTKHKIPVNFGSDVSSSILSSSTYSESSKSEKNSLGRDEEPLLLDTPSRHVTSNKYAYTSLLSEGQLYFRSWQELDVQLGQNTPTKQAFQVVQPNSLPDYREHPNKKKSKSTSQKRPKPYFPSMPDLPQPLSTDVGWMTEVGDFIAVHLLNHPFIDGKRMLVGSDCLNNDGILWLLIIRAGISKKDLLNYMNLVDSSESLNGPLPDCIDLIPVRGIRLTPLSTDMDIYVDGELLDCDCLQAFVMPGVARTLTL